jgi:hypothetical protein
MEGGHDGGNSSEKGVITVTGIFKWEVMWAWRDERATSSKTDYHINVDTV